MPVILATQETKIGRIAVGSQPGKTVLKTHLKNTQHKKKLGRWRLGGLQFKPSPGKKFKRLYLNQWLGTVIHGCYPSYVKRHK
jgi:hypothetical protein